MIMARLESPQIEVLTDSAGENYDSQILTEEEVSLLRKNRRKTQPVRRARHNNALKLMCCLKSKGIFVILCWNTLVTLMLMPWLEVSTYSLIVSVVRHISIQHALPIAVPSFYGFRALLFLFYPLAGYIADTRWGRYKTIFRSLWYIFWSGLFVAIGAAILACYLLLQPYYGEIPLITIALLAAGLGVPFIICVILLFTCTISFRANIIQFGMDQVRDAPAEDSVLFIHWFVFTSFVGLTMIRFVSSLLTFNNASSDIPKIVAGGFCGLYITVLLFLLVSLCIVQHRHHRSWFMIESTPDSRKIINPYKLVYKVIKFAAQHKTPIHRSAFTYCEDELPSRMDLGKEKYGGPFTTEQVEDVKTFFGILRILLMLGPFFGTHLATGHARPKNEKSASITFFTHGGVTDFLIVVLIPGYICLLRPIIRRYILGMLKRIGLGMTLLLLFSVCNLLLDTIGHVNIHNNNHTMTCYDDPPPDSVGLSRLYLIFLHILSAVGYMLFYIATYEFIFAQSPHAMKGLLVGTFFAIEGVFQLIGAIGLASLTRLRFEDSFPNCSFIYSLINILIALLGLVAYTWVARKYQYRQRDEPDNIYRYAEEYYARQNS